MSAICSAERSWTGRYVLYFSIVVIGCAADLLTKHYVFQWRGMPRADNVWWILEGYVGIETALNPGALFGFGKVYGFVFAAFSVWYLGESLHWNHAVGFALIGLGAWFVFLK